MRLVTPTEAAATLGCSERTIRRKLASGQLRKVSQSGRTLVEVETLDPLADVSGKLAEVTTAHAIQRRTDSDTMSAVVATLDRALERADYSERRAMNAVRWSVLAASGVGIAAVVAVLAVAWYTHTEAVNHAGTVASLETSLTGQLSKTATLQTALTGARLDRDGLAEAVRVAEARAAEALTIAATLQLERDGLAETVRETGRDLTEARKTAATLRLERDGLQAGLDVRDAIRRAWSRVSSALRTSPEDQDAPGSTIAPQTHGSPPQVATGP